MIKKFNLRLLALSSCTCLLLGCTSSSLFLANTLARLNDYTVIEDRTYGKGKFNTLDIYVPEVAQSLNTPFPVVIFFYGGCWGGCTTFNKENYRFVAQALTSNNFITIIGDYRRYPDVLFPEIINDSKQIVEWVKTHIKDYQGDSDRIFLMGHSAGAHLAAMLTLNENYLEPETYQAIKGFIGLAGPYDFLPLTEPYQKTIFGPLVKYPDSQPINFIDGYEPPLLLLQGNHDTKVLPKNAKNLYRKVKQKLGCAQLQLYENMDHSEILAAFATSIRIKKPILSDVIKFLQHYSVPNAQCRTKSIN
jgi:acetyl esterase/lipase